MTTPDIIDVDSLLVPFDGDNPAGVDIREDSSPQSIYYKIKDARAAARASERRLLAEEDPDAANTVVPEWDTVIDLAPQILTDNGKDLEVAAWYTEALLREHGFPGLRDGFRLLRGLVEGFWDNLYPMPDEDGIETRVAPLTGLNGEEGEGTLIIPINKVLITQGHTYSPYATWHYQQAYDLDRITDPEKREARIADGAITMKMIEQSVLETAQPFFTEIRDDLSGCAEEFSKLSAALDEKCGTDSPPTSNIRNALNRVMEVINFIAPEQAAEESGEGEETGAQSSGPSAAKPSGGGAINNREDAYRSMLTVAKFFRETEPHSPVSYMLEKAVRLGKMSLPEVLAELITDENARYEYFRLTGIAPPEQEGY